MQREARDACFWIRLRPIELVHNQPLLAAIKDWVDAVQLPPLPPPVAAVALDGFAVPVAARAPRLRSSPQTEGVRASCTEGTSARGDTYSGVTSEQSSSSITAETIAVDIGMHTAAELEERDTMAATASRGEGEEFYGEEEWLLRVDGQLELPVLMLPKVQ